MSPNLRLARTLAAHYSDNADALLGEFELAFIVFITLSSAAGFELWKSVLHLVRCQLCVYLSLTYCEFTGRLLSATMLLKAGFMLRVGLSAPSQSSFGL